MRFTVLGPLQAVRDPDGDPVPLGGTNQRALLGFLLLRPNRVAGTGELIRALWGEGAPPTARKMVQNAVAGLRRALAGDPGVDLSTVPPGYLLRLDPGTVDLTRFDALAREGGEAVRAGQWERGTALLGEALALWRGPALADLAGIADVGAGWRGLAAIEEARLTAYEDWAEAELQLGGHRAVAGRLMAAHERNPARERTCRLLMLSLYRSGRQPEALAAYRRLRAALVGGYGLDPAPELQDLERAILTRHPGLTAPPAPGGGAATGLTTGLTTGPGSGTVLGPGTRSTNRSGTGTTTAPTALPTALPTTGTALASTVATAAWGGTPDPPGPPADVPPGPRPYAERRQATVLLARAALSGGAGAEDPERTDEVLSRVRRLVSAEAARHGGLPREPLGPVFPVLFGLPHAHEDDPERAVRTALALRDRLGGAVRLAVATGDVLARYTGEDDPGPAEVTGAVLDRCERLLRLAEPGGVRVCARSHALLTADGEPPGAAGPHPGTTLRTLPAPSGPRAPAAPLIGREHDLDALTGLLAEALHAGRPHLATLLGEPGVGKSRLAAEFARRAGAPPGGRVLHLSARVPAFGPGYGGERVGGRDPHGPHDPHVPDVPDPYDGYEARWRLAVETAARQPVLLVIEDLHHAPDAFLDQVESLTERAPGVPLFVVATARPQLLRRRPDWGRGRPGTSALVLDPLGEGATAVLLDRLAGRPFPAVARAQVLELVGGIPRFAEEYAAAARRAPGRVPELPAVVRAAATARLDTLPPAQRSVLRDAAVLGPTVSAAGVAAVGGRTPRQAAEVLRQLESEDLVRRVRRGALPDPIEYAVRRRLLADVGYDQLTRHDRTLGHRRAVEWISGLPPRYGHLLVRHHRLLLALAAPGTSADQACRALIDAGRAAAGTGAHEAALRCYRGAVEVGPAAATQRRRQLALLYERSLRAIDPGAAALRPACG